MNIVRGGSESIIIRNPGGIYYPPEVRRGKYWGLEVF